MPKIDAGLKVAQTATSIGSAYVAHQNYYNKPIIGQTNATKQTAPIKATTKQSVSKPAVDKNSIAISNKNNPLTGTKYTNKVHQQMKHGDFHSFPNHVDAFGTDGRITEIIGGDGIVRRKLEISGSYKGRIGYFEYIIEPNNTINHRFFRPNK